jgi:hypothetical protein
MIRQTTAGELGRTIRTTIEQVVGAKAEAPESLRNVLAYLWAAHDELELAASHDFAHAPSERGWFATVVWQRNPPTGIDTQGPNRGREPGSDA